jgi:hypothetical protein
LTSILATRSCPATKSRDGTKSSETFQGLLIFWVFVGFWDFQRFKDSDLLGLQDLFQHFLSQGRRIWTNVLSRLFSENKCLLHADSGDISCQRSIRSSSSMTEAQNCIVNYDRCAIIMQIAL